MIVMHTQTLEAIRPLSDDERLGKWAARYFSAGLHRNKYEAPEDSAKEESETKQ